MRRQPVREGVISISVAIGERTVWLGCGQYTGPQGFLPFWFHGNRAAGAELQIPKTIKGWTALHTQLLFPSTVAEKGKQQVGAGKGWRRVWSCPQLWECPKAIAVSLTTPASPLQAPSQLWPFHKGESNLTTAPLGHWGRSLLEPRPHLGTTRAGSQCCCPGTNLSQKTGVPDHQQPLAVDTSPDI